MVESEVEVGSGVEVCAEMAVRSCIKAKALASLGIGDRGILR